ncbi:M20 family metallopeptidase [Streptomyces sp. NBC_00988]|uniref:M20 family metallopeptidase n=1 Tax=Streptomyces sp. NBC_00988 TaxID=2903704 RepID=UPI00386C9F25|nr:M20 family metallopeptidase [Streptomyces sp. NBC_00988]
MTEVVDLTRRLIALNTVDRNESSAHAIVGPLLEAVGFTVHVFEYAPGRGTLVADWATRQNTPPLCLSGHLDTVPLGSQDWRHDPHTGEIDGDRLYGRGASDMKGGVAAIVLAAVRMATNGHPRRAGVRIILTAAEETGALGARHLQATLRDRRSGPLLIAEPTANAVVHGHKGALWLEARASGITAHSSTPHLGDNAVYKLARAVTSLETFAFPCADAPHPVMGTPTLNVGTFHGGLNPNSVPDQARATIDVRTVPGQRHPDVVDQLAQHTGPGITLTSLLDLPPVWTDPDDTWARETSGIASDVTGSTTNRPRAATYFTDAAILTPLLGSVPTLICGPGQPELAHVTDEWCSVTRLQESSIIYERIIQQWCGL